MARRAPLRVRIPASRPSASTAGASLRLAPSSALNASRGSLSAAIASTSLDMTSESWVKRSTPVRSCSVTIPTGRRSASTTTPAPWARLGSRDRASPTVWEGDSTIGVSSTRCRDLTQPTTSATTSMGMSWGMTTSPPRRATVSAIRRPHDRGHVRDDERDGGAGAVGGGEVDVLTGGDGRPAGDHEHIVVRQVVGRCLAVEETHADPVTWSSTEGVGGESAPGRGGPGRRLLRHHRRSPGPGANTGTRFCGFLRTPGADLGRSSVARA